MAPEKAPSAHLPARPSAQDDGGPIAAHLDALRELGAATAEAEHEHPGVDLLGAFVRAYEAQRARLRATAVQGHDGLDLGDDDDARSSAPLSDPARCDCGAALAHVHSENYSAVLCPECDADALAESPLRPSQARSM